MSTKLPTHLLNTYATFKPHFLSLRVLQSQCPPSNPSLPPPPFLLPALHPPAPRSSIRGNRQIYHQQQSALFTSTAFLSKKGGKQDTKRPPPNLPSSRAEVDSDDMSTYEGAIAQAHERLREELKKVQVGGVVRDLEALEAVRLKGGGRLGDVGQVVPRGRNVVVMVGEKEDVKLITAALSQPPHNLSPQPSPTEPLTIMIPLPPITQEARQEAAKVVGQKGEAALFALREARGAHRKGLQKLLAGKVKNESDEFHKAEKEMEKVNERAVAQAKKMVEEGKKRVLGQ